MNISLNRIILFVQNVTDLKTFYQTHFHFELLEEIENKWALLKAGNCEIGLHKAGYNYVGKGGNGESSNAKLVFEVDGDIHQFRDQLLNAGVTLKEIKSLGSPYYLFCDGQDLEGNVFQLMWRVA